MLAQHRKKLNTSQHGIALAITMLVLLLISTIVAGMIVMANSESFTSANFRDEQTAFFAARAGLEEVRDRLRTTSANVVTPPTALPGTANGVLYITNPLSGETVKPWLTSGSNYPDDEICFELACTSGVPSGGSGWYTSASAGASYAATPTVPWKWVRLMAKINRSLTTTRTTSVDGTTSGLRVCWNGANEITVASTYASCQAANASYYPVYTVTALAVTSSGSRRMTQYEITPAALPTFPGAMIFDGTSPDFSTNPHSNHTHASGTDVAQGPNAGVGCAPAINQPAIGTVNNTTSNTISGQLNDPSDFVGSPSGVAPIGSTLSANSSMNLTTVDGLTKLVNTITAAAGNNIYNSGNVGSINLGSSSSPVINVVNGDLAIGSGSGILLVTGTLTENGGSSYNGLILVIGKGSVTKNGGGGGVSNGSMFLANMYTDTSYTTPIGLGANNPPGPTSMTWNGGGNALMQYDSCWVNSVIGGFPLKLVSMRELIYK